MIVTIDGPAGAGKSSAARELARRLDFQFLDTGAMYRAVTLAAQREGIDLADADALLRVAKGCEITATGDQVTLNGQDVTREIRASSVTAATHHAADHQGVRAHLTELQRHAGRHRDIVTEGRDQATVVFRDAECKIYLTASEEVRAERRYIDLVNRGERVSLQDVLDQQRDRDGRDKARPQGGLAKADGAIRVSTDGMSHDEVVAKLMDIVQQCKPTGC
ncbi:Cytidylate kinase [Posidoniimonas polymericola]|uniref:Cytidylate kinase n=1 Tax=Posidoniimonas polymericola TaxID=2528002 RepID=A0A5C5YEX3_9BACT|nr:(d)CMP kinase [Posidoniimonas polymericola]TWT73558.1 Cytidylate kinase [Posidoniimonas polymericola]